MADQPAGQMHSEGNGELKHARAALSQVRISVRPLVEMTREIDGLPYSAAPDLTVCL